MMATPKQSSAPPRLLLATDLSARCDRALDRAAQLAAEWHADLVALHVLEPAASPDQVLAWARGASDEQLLNVAQQQLAHDLAAANVPARLRLVRSDDVPSAIQQAAASTGSNVVVTGASGSCTFGQILLGTTVQNLASSLSQALLTVRKRVLGPYRRIVVATDFSASSRHALLAAINLFPNRELILYHAHPPTMLGVADASPHPDVCIGIEQTECAAFLAETSIPADVNMRPVIEYGAIESTLTRYVHEHQIDLMVMGSHGSSGLMSLLLGTTATKLLDWLPCDTLLVPEPAASAGRMQAYAGATV